jgi:phage tail-like protein
MSDPNCPPLGDDILPFPECTDPISGPQGGFDAFGSPKLVKNVRIRRGLEGPQLILEWDAPNEVPEFGGGLTRVMRKLYDFSRSPDDGMLVFEKPTEDDNRFVADIDLDPCKCYYYTIFTFDPVDGRWRYSLDTQAEEIAIPTGFFTTELFKLLPELYVFGDKHLDEDIDSKESNVFALEKTFSPEEREWFNLYENTDPTKEPIKKGPLQRFMRTLAIEPDIVKGLIDCMPILWDVDETCCEVLPALGALIGLEVNQEFDCAKQRQEIKQQVAIYKIKGTKAGLRARALSVAGLSGDIHEWSNNILIANRIDRTSLAFPNAGFSSKFMLPGDDTSYTPGGVIGFVRFCIFLNLDCDDCLAQQVVEKLIRELGREIPVCRIGHVIFVDCKWVECYDTLRRVQETSKDIIKDYIIEDFRTHCWLITNRLTDTNSPPPLGPDLNLPFEHHYTNSIHALTANPFRVCQEIWYDDIEQASKDIEDLSDCWLISNRIERITNTFRWRTPPVDESRCIPLDDWYDEVQVGEFVEPVNCETLGLLFISNRPAGHPDLPPSLTNTLQSLVGPCFVAGEFWYDEIICAGRINRGRINCARINQP